MLASKIYEALQRNQMTTSQLAMALGADVVPTLRILADMEARGQVLRMPDGTWAIKRHEVTRVTKFIRQ